MNSTKSNRLTNCKDKVYEGENRLPFEQIDGWRVIGRLSSQVQQKTLLGESRFKQSRGQELMSSTTSFNSVSVKVLKSKPLGKKKNLKRPFVFSLEPRCQSECGSAKYTVV